MLDRAARSEELEALVLLHQEVEIADPGFCAKVPARFEDPDVAVVGVAGGDGRALDRLVGGRDQLAAR